MEKYIRFVTFTDSSFGNLEEGGSQGAVIMGIQDMDTGFFSPLHWQSRRLRRVVHSTLAAETEAAVDGVGSMVVLAAIWDEVFQSSEGPVSRQLFTDCKSLYDHLSRKREQCGEKRLLIALSSLRSDLEDGTLTALNWCLSEDQLADSLTKAMTPKFLLDTLRTGQLFVREGLINRQILSKGLKKKKTSVEISPLLTIPPSRALFHAIGFGELISPKNQPTYEAWDFQLMGA